MNYPFPATIRQLVEERMESGRYTSEDEVLVTPCNRSRNMTRR